MNHSYYTDLLSQISRSSSKSNFVLPPPNSSFMLYSISYLSFSTNNSLSIYLLAACCLLNSSSIIVIKPFCQKPLPNYFLFFFSCFAKICYFVTQRIKESCTFIHPPLFVSTTTITECMYFLHKVLPLSFTIYCLHFIFICGVWRYWDVRLGWVVYCQLWIDEYHVRGNYSWKIELITTYGLIYDRAHLFNISNNYYPI